MTVRHEVRVIFGDTDQMGIVYYANYYRYFEGARAAYLREQGRSYKDMHEWGVALPVVESHCKYLSPARYEDELLVHTEVTQIRGASLRFEYRITRGETLIVEGYSVHACVYPDTGRPRRIPPELKALLGD
ncbi:MAG: acyl-CoA thioesterase [Myxococcales bacterium]|nr:acyl-CoA thioesterase [Myxococcales bacterium]